MGVLSITSAPTLQIPSMLSFTFGIYPIFVLHEGGQGTYIAATGPQASRCRGHSHLMLESPTNLDAELA